MMIVHSEADVALLRHDDLLAAAARERFITAANQPLPSATPRPVGRIRAGLRHAGAALLHNDDLIAEIAVVVSLVALASIG